MAMKLSDFTVLSFDCYGTLIDWEAGILDSLSSLRSKIANPPTDEELLQTFARLESEQERSTPQLLYSKILAEVYRRLATHYQVAISPEDWQTFASSVPNWPAFTDSVEALKYLKKHYKLVILSNVDRVSFAGSNKRLEVIFDYIFTAQDIGSYKPNPNNFQYMLNELAKDDIRPSQILHTAQSIYHDHIPATNIGLAKAWIDRRKGQEGWGATAVPKEMPTLNFHFGSLGEMADAHKKETV